MRREEFEKLPRVPARKPTICVEHLTGPDRTLLYGYTIDRTTFHVYLKDGEIHVHEFDLVGTLDHTAAEEWPTEELIPEKRAYPHATDRQFAELVLSQGVAIPWTTFNDDKADWSGFYVPTADQHQEEE